MDNGGDGTETSYTLKINVRFDLRLEDKLIRDECR